MRKALIKIFIKIITIAVIFLNYSFSVFAETPLSLDHVQLSAKRFDPTKGQKTTLTFQANQTAVATVQLYNFLGEKVAVLLNKKIKKGVTQTVAWNGRDDLKKSFPPGVYYYTIVLKNDNGSMTYNPYPQTEGHLLSILEGGYDEKNDRIYFTLPQAAMARVRINIKKGGPIMATPIDWTPFPAGQYRFPWNGKDAANLIDLKNHPERNIMVYAYSLADNSIIVDGKTEVPDQPFVPLDENAMARQEFSLNLPPDRYIHARKDPRLNRVARIEVTLPEAKMQDDVPVLSGKSPVRVAIDPRDQWIAEMSRYELMFYVDTVVVFEDESGFAPFTYNLNTQDLTEGEHVLTVNLLTYDDHYATVSRKIIIRHEKKKNI